MQIIVDELLTNYRIQGSGKIVLLLHGWGDELSTFDKLTQSLESQYRVVRLDLPGFGGTETPKITYSLSLFAKFIKNFLQKIHCPDIYAIIGHSNGGAISMKGISNNTLSCQKLVLLASSGIRTDYKGRKKVFRIITKSAKLPTKLLPETTQLKIKKKVYSLMGSDMFVAESMQDTFKQVLSEDLAEDSKNIIVKTLILYGSLDEATPPEYGHFFSDNIRDSKLVVIKDAGHFLHNSNSEEVDSFIKVFLEQK